MLQADNIAYSMSAVRGIDDVAEKVDEVDKDTGKNIKFPFGVDKERTDLGAPATNGVEQTAGKTYNVEKLLGLTIGKSEGVSSVDLLEWKPVGQRCSVNGLLLDEHTFAPKEAVPILRDLTPTSPEECWNGAALGGYVPDVSENY